MGFRVIDEKRSEGEAPIAEATIRMSSTARRSTRRRWERPGERHGQRLAEGAGEILPRSGRGELLDYKVRVIRQEGTGSSVRVLIKSGDRDAIWGTVGVSHNIIEASWQALVDSIRYKLWRTRACRFRGAGSGGAGNDAPSPSTSFPDPSGLECLRHGAARRIGRTSPFDGQDRRFSRPPVRLRQRNGPSFRPKPPKRPTHDPPEIPPWKTDRYQQGVWRSRTSPGSPTVSPPPWWRSGIALGSDSVPSRIFSASRGSRRSGCRKILPFLSENAE